MDFLGNLDRHAAAKQRMANNEKAQKHASLDNVKTA